MSHGVTGERGAVSTFLAVIALALLMAAGLAIDGGRKVNTLREASHLADNAARAGAQAVDLDTLRHQQRRQLRCAVRVVARLQQNLAQIIGLALRDRLGMEVIEMPQEVLAIVGARLQRTERGDEVMLNPPLEEGRKNGNGTNGKHHKKKTKTKKTARSSSTAREQDKK